MMQTATDVVGYFLFCAAPGFKMPAEDILIIITKNNRKPTTFNL